MSIPVPRKDAEPLDFKCPTCGAAPGVDCIVPGLPGRIDSERVFLALEDSEAPVTERISAAQLAAAEAIFDAWYNASHPAMRTPDRIEEWREEASKLAEIAVAAIAAKGWGEAEAATRALRDLVDAVAPRVQTVNEPSALAAARALVGPENRKADE